MPNTGGSYPHGMVEHLQRLPDHLLRGFSWPVQSLKSTLELAFSVNVSAS
jgi:hypothetical protein